MAFNGKVRVKTVFNLPLTKRRDGFFEYFAWTTNMLLSYITANVPQEFFRTLQRPDLKETGRKTEMREDISVIITLSVFCSKYLWKVWKVKMKDNDLFDCIWINYLFSKPMFWTALKRIYMFNVLECMSKIT